MPIITITVRNSRAPRTARRIIIVPRVRAEKELVVYTYITVGKPVVGRHEWRRERFTRKRAKYDRITDAVLHARRQLFARVCKYIS